MHAKILQSFIFFLVSAVVQVETDKWCRNIMDQDIILLQITFTDPVLAQGWFHQGQAGSLAGTVW